MHRLKRIALDEICLGKGHRYLTGVMHLDAGAVVFVGDGKGAEAREPFWKKLRSSKAKIKAVAIEMSPAYIRAVRDHLPKARLVFDHCPGLKPYNDKLSNLRRRRYHELPADQQKKVLKGIRWVLLQNPENRDTDKEEAPRRQEARQRNKPLAPAYYMKEELRQFWNQPDKDSAAAFLLSWIARASGVSRLKRFANTLAAHKTGLLAYYDAPLSTGPLAGTTTRSRPGKSKPTGFGIWNASS